MGLIIGILIDGILKAIKSNSKSNMPTPKPEPDPKPKPNIHLPQNQTQLDSVSIRRGASVFNILCYSINHGYEPEETDFIEDDLGDLPGSFNKSFDGKYIIICRITRSSR